jgi:hypothetical protein
MTPPCGLTAEEEKGSGGDAAEGSAPVGADDVEVELDVELEGEGEAEGEEEDEHEVRLVLQAGGEDSALSVMQEQN